MFKIKTFALLECLVFLLWANCVDRMATEGRLIPSRGFSGSHTGTRTYEVDQRSKPGRCRKYTNEGLQAELSESEPPPASHLQVLEVLPQHGDACNSPGVLVKLQI